MAIKHCIAPASTLRGGSHGFDVLRLLAATMVIFGHAFPLSGAAAPGFLGNSVQTLGVKIFFVISGFLITRSWLALPQWPAFLLKRALRIWPGLLVNVALAALVLGPCLTSLSLHDYFLSVSPWRYLRNALLYPVYGLGGVFEGNLYKHAVNGSLWSLPVEVVMYLAVPLVVMRSFATRMPVGPSAFARASVVAFALLLLSLAYVRLAPPPQPAVFYGTSLGSLLDVACYFWFGSVMSFVAEATLLPLRGVLAAVLAFGSVIQDPVVSEIYLALFLPPLVVGLGLCHLSGWEKLVGTRDYSYGLYLYGFPIQQSVVAVVGVTTPLMNFALSVPFVVAFAVFSWHVVERPAIGLKLRLSQRKGVCI